MTSAPVQSTSRTAACRAAAAAGRAAAAANRAGRSSAPAAPIAPARLPSSPLERLHTLKELEAAGYGARLTLTRRIHDGTLPAVMVGNRFKIRESDLHLIAAPVDPATLGESAA
ncbi:MerR family transcriptional regulator [Micrococcus luteus]|uniref:hypothetical protein n=1 Tax=Micrococcus luteus TaxID=1270 RepID=UPI00080E445B|nr:hypothetical protein [Micrococcus luteus]